jgi:molybdopterin converting factor small subunit
MRVLYLHSLRQITGCTEEVLSETPATVDALISLLLERHPALGPHRASLRIARNHEWAAPEDGLSPNDEVAVMPPLSGG